jgi:dipeptidyl aminopeptidase/acylaminoacyl peptidase
MEQLEKNIAIRGGSFNHDESKLLVSSNETGIYNVYTIDLATGVRTAVTEGQETTYSVAFMPHDDRILFRRDTDGNEIHHLFLRELDGSVRDLTTGAETRELFFGFAHDLGSFYTTNNGRDKRFNDLYEWDIEKLQPTLVYQNDLGLEPAGISPDRRWLALTRFHTTNDIELLVKDLEAGGEAQAIAAREGEAVFSFMDFSADSRHLYYTSNAGGEFQVLKRYDLESGSHEDVFSCDWDVVYSFFSLQGTYQVIATNEDGYTEIRIIRTATGEQLEIPDLPAGTINGVGFAVSESKMRLYLSSDTMPANLYLYDLEAGAVKRLTDTLNPEVDPADLVTSTVARFSARDGMEIPGPLYRPLGAGPENRVPVLIWVHGGPGGQSRAGYDAEVQLLLNHGYGVFAVNNRGSTGYGKSFYAADDQRHGREPLWDCIDAKEYLKTLDWVDGERIGIIGGSYGGYMVLAALAFEPEEFKVGVDIFGVANWLRTLQNIPPWWESFRNALYQELGNPETQEQMLRDASPVFHADKIVRPLMILQGANDPRVLQAESDDMVAAIQANNGIVEYLVFEDEGHGFRKSENRIEGWNAILKFLDTHL